MECMVGVVFHGVTAGVYLLEGGLVIKSLQFSCKEVKQQLGRVWVALRAIGVPVDMGIPSIAHRMNDADAIAITRHLCV